MWFVISTSVTDIIDFTFDILINVRNGGQFINLAYLNVFLICGRQLSKFIVNTLAYLRTNL